MQPWRTSSKKCRLCRIYELIAELTARMDEVPFDHKIGAVRLYITSLERSIVAFAASVVKEGYDLKLCDNCANKLKNDIGRFRLDLTMKEGMT
jgi:hypothetical protein